MFRPLINLLGVLSPAHISWFTLVYRSEKVGTDVYGNRYFQGRPRKGYNRPRRWVVYKGKPEASSVPPEWHGWLHHQTNAVPNSESASFRRPWQKSHQRNMTGTQAAYRPPGHILQGGNRTKATGDYEAWIPPK